MNLFLVYLSGQFSGSRDGIHLPDIFLKIGKNMPQTRNKNTFINLK